MRVHECDGLCESVVFNHSVRIQEKHILALREPYRLIVSLRETHILLVGNHLDLRELSRKHLQRTVNRIIIHNKHLTFNTLHRPAH